MDYNEITKAEHYNSHPSGIECIQIVEHMNFCLGSAMKYIWRAGLKSEDKIKDLEKAKYYINREIKKIEEEEDKFEKIHQEYIKTNY